MTKTTTEIAEKIAIAIIDLNAALFALRQDRFVSAHIKLLTASRVLAGAADDCASAEAELS